VVPRKEIWTEAINNNNNNNELEKNHEVKLMGSTSANWQNQSLQ
jgi:hypothetical protein